MVVVVVEETISIHRFLPRGFLHRRGATARRSCGTEGAEEEWDRPCGVRQGPLRLRSAKGRLGWHVPPVVDNRRFGPHLRARERGTFISTLRLSSRECRWHCAERPCTLRPGRPAALKHAGETKTMRSVIELEGATVAELANPILHCVAFTKL